MDAVELASSETCLNAGILDGGHYNSIDSGASLNGAHLERACLDPPKKEENQYNYQYEANPAGRIIAPTSAMWPTRKHTQQSHN